MKKFIHSTVLAAVAATGLAAGTPAMAQYYRGDRYDYRNDGYRDGRAYDRGYQNRGYDNRGYDNRGYAYNNRYRGERCRNSGSTGTILGAIAGGLLGREIGRGGYRNRPSTTGLIVGAGAGALAGRAIDKGNCR